MLKIISISSIFLASSLQAVTTFDTGVLIPQGKISYHDLVYGLLSNQQISKYFYILAELYIVQ